MRWKSKRYSFDSQGAPSQAGKMARIVVLTPQAVDVGLQFEVELREDVAEQGFLKTVV